MVLVKKIAGYAGIAIALAILVVFVMPSYRQGEASMAGKTARDFDIQLDGKPAHLSDLKGKVVVLNFWATWCPPCVEETPALNGLQQRIASRGGVVLGVSVDEDETAYQKFLKDNGIVFFNLPRPEQKIGSGLWDDYVSGNLRYRSPRKGRAKSDWTAAMGFSGNALLF